MAARWLQSKLRKLRAQRSKAPKSYKSGGVDSNAIANNAIFDNQSRVATTSGPKHDRVPRLHNTFTQKVPETFSLNSKNTEAYYDPDLKCWVPKGWVPSNRSKNFEAWKFTREEEGLQRKGLWLKEQLLSTWQGVRHQGLVAYHRSIIREVGGYRLTLYFHGTEFVFEQVSDNVRWLSKTYRSADEAREVLRSREYVWVKMETIKKP